MENSVKADLKRRKYTRLERTLVLVVSALIVATGLTAGFMIFRYISDRNAPPQNYYDFQLRYQRAMLDKNPKDPTVRTNIGYIYMKMGDEARGLSYFNEALALDKNFVPALYNVGMYHKRHGRMTEAVSFLTRAGEHAVKGNKYLAYYSLGELYFDKKDYDKAIELVKISLEDNATIWNAYEMLGRAYEAKDDKAQAAENYKKALSFNPTNETLQRKVDSLTDGSAATK